MLHALHDVGILGGGVGRAGQEDGIIVDAQLLGRAVAAEVGGVHPAADFAAAGGGELFLALRHQLLGHHAAVDDIRVDVGQRVGALHGAETGFHTAEPVAVKEELLCAAVEPDLAAQFPEALDHGSGELVGGVGQNVGTAGGVLVHHGGIVDEGQVLHVDAQVAPVDREDILALLGQFQRVKDLLGAVGAGFEHVGVGRAQNLGIRAAAGGGDVGDAVQHFLEEVEKLDHLLPGAGNIDLHLVDEGVDTGGHGHIHDAAVAVGGDAAEAVSHLDEVCFHAVGVHHGAQIAGVVRGAVVAELMQRGIDLEAASHKAGGRAAGQVVLLDEQGLSARQLTLQGCGHAGVAGAHNDDIIFGHLCIPPF